MTSRLSAHAIVRAWETAARRRPLDRALALLWAAGEQDDPAALPLAERDRRLLALRHATFGDRLDCVTECPDCGAGLELELSASELGQALPAPVPETVEGIEIRPLDSRDLAEAAALPEDEIASFLRRRACGTSEMPEDLAAEIGARIEAREAAAELRFALECTECGAEWHETLDVAGHVWADLARAARRVMAETAEIAAAYGWSEAEILAMTEARRRVYLEIARGG